MPPSTPDERGAFLADDYDSETRRLLEDHPDGLTSTINCWFRFLWRRVLHRRSRLLFLIPKYLVYCLLALVIFVPIFAPSYNQPPQRYRDLLARCAGSVPPTGCANPLNEQVFISITLYDKDGHLLGGDWGRLLLELIHLIGEQNVFLSIYENDNALGGTAALEAFRKKLSFQHELVHDVHVPLDDFSTVTMPDGSQRVKRLMYMSELRNRALRPLDRRNESIGSFDKVLFLNDVFYNPVDAAQLLFSTNTGPDGRTEYLATCGLDFGNPLLFYDLYATRDAEGHSMGLPIWPIFSTAGAASSRQDMMAQKDAVRVSSCWSGIVAMEAKWLQNQETALPTPDFQSLSSHVIDPWRPSNITAPVRWRCEPEIFLDACECCLFLADVATAARKADVKEAGVFMNPYVRVTYRHGLLRWVRLVQRWERLFSLPQGILSWLAGLPTHNPYRTLKEGQNLMEEIWVENREAKDNGTWSLVERKARNGMFCAVREMQVLKLGERTSDENWKNVPIPTGQAYYFPT